MDRFISKEWCTHVLIVWIDSQPNMLGIQSYPTRCISGLLFYMSTYWSTQVKDLVVCSIELLSQEPVTCFERLSSDLILAISVTSWSPYITTHIHNTCMHTYIHTYIRTYIHEYVRKDTYKRNVSVKNWPTQLSCQTCTNMSILLSLQQYL